MPVPGTNDEEWDRLEPASALDALVELVLHGEYNGVFAEKRKREEMESTPIRICEGFIRQTKRDGTKDIGRSASGREVPGSN